MYFELRTAVYSILFKGMTCSWWSINMKLCLTKKQNCSRKEEKPIENCAKHEEIITHY